MHDLSENSPGENFANENLRKYRTSSRREQERLRRALEEQAAWAREQQRIADEQRQAIERKQAELRRKAMGLEAETAGNGNGGAIAIDLFNADGPLHLHEKRELDSDFSEQFFFYSLNFSGQEVPDCVLFLYSDIRDSHSDASLIHETEGLKSFVTSKRDLALTLNDKPLAKFDPIEYPIVLIVGLSLGVQRLKIRQSRFPFLFVRELKMAFELTEPGTYSVQLIARYLDERRRTIFGNKLFRIYQPKLCHLD